MTNTPDIETRATWSPTEDQLLFGSIPNTEHALELWPYEANALYLTEGSEANLTELGNSYHILSATWSPNGEKIAYSNDGQMCIFNLETESDSCPLEDIPPYNSYFAASGDYPSWSADGNWLAFRATGHKEELCYRVYILELSTNTVVPADRENCRAGPLYWLHFLH
jgi:dipeptidyl aminopeptidase/acylaminoacyl peptidase